MSLDSVPIRNESGNEADEMTFYDACANGNLRVVKIYLSQQGFKFNDGDNNARTGFHRACLNGHLNVVQYLVQKGFNMNTGIGNNYYGMTGFHLACDNGKLNVVQFLLQQGFNMNVCDNDGKTGFHLACEYGTLNVVQFLVQQKFDMNVGDNGGSTGFHLACFNGKLNVVQFLLQQEFDINVVDNDGETGLDTLIANFHHYDDYEAFLPCALFLIESGATLNENDVFEELISAIQNRIIEITFTEQTIFQKWTGRIAQAITDFTMEPYTNTSLQNLSQILN